MSAYNLLVAQFENPGIGLNSTNQILNSLEASNSKYEVVEACVFGLNSFLAIVRTEAEIDIFQNDLDAMNFSWIESPHPDLLSGLYSLNKLEVSENILIAQAESLPSLLSFIDSNLKAQSIKVIDIFSGRGNGGSPVLYAQKTGEIKSADHVNISEIDKLNGKLQKSIF